MIVGFRSAKTFPFAEREATIGGPSKHQQAQLEAFAGEAVEQLPLVLFVAAFDDDLVEFGKLPPLRLRQAQRGVPGRRMVAGC